VETAGARHRAGARAAPDSRTLPRRAQRMTESGPDGRGERAGDRAPEAAGAPPLPWLLPRKIAVPDLLADHLDRAGLADRAMPTRRRLTVLKAPGGFGKTTLLAECCRRLRADGVPVAWIAVDAQDEPDVLDTYIAWACQSAAAGAAARPDTVAAPGPGDPDSGSRTARAAREIAQLDGPFVLVFDELERLSNPGSAALLDFLLRRGPANLHLAFACRELPAGLNLAGDVLDGRAAMISSDDLRFSRSEVADFFRGRLSRPRLAALMSESSGWPFAVRLSRNALEGGEGNGAEAARELADNWIEARLLARLREDDREFLLDIALFDWIDATLLDEVLEQSGSMRRIDAMPALAGLFEGVHGADADVRRLHPLLREHCARRRLNGAPERFRTVHRRIADALARRGQTAAAMRHAAEAGEPGLAGAILQRAGGVFLWLREGTVQLLAADRWLREEVVAARPRLALVRCLALLLAGRLEEARRRYRSLSASFAGLEADAGDAGLELAAENCVVRGMIFLHGSERLGSETVRSQIAEFTRLAESPHTDATVRAYAEHCLAIANSLMARFRPALEHAARARQSFVANPYMTMYGDVVTGQIAMARGRTEEAAAHYHRAERVARKSYLLDPAAPAMCAVLLQELALECNGGAALTGVTEAAADGSWPFQPHAAAAANAIDLRLRDRGVDAALARADELLGAVRAASQPTLVRYLAALRISLLAVAGRAGEAERAWAADRLPEAAADCLDLAALTWREMEALACAHLRLTIAQGRFEAAREFAGKLREAAEARELTRTAMRTLALSAALEHRAGEAAQATAHLEAYLRLYADAPYAGPLLRERADCAPVLAAFLRSTADPPARKAAQWLLGAMRQADNPRQPVLTEREREVLMRLGRQRDKQIADELGLSEFGVRYHLRKLFAKLGARNRDEAARRAREMGLVPADS